MCYFVDMLIFTWKKLNICGNSMRICGDNGRSVFWPGPLEVRGLHKIGVTPETYRPPYVCKKNINSLDKSIMLQNCTETVFGLNSHIVLMCDRMCVSDCVIYGSRIGHLSLERLDICRQKVVKRC